jgi:ferredoxin
MKELIKEEIKKFVLESKSNYSEAINDYWFEEPIVNFADADDPLFEEYKKIIGNYHLTPKEALELAFGEGSYTEGTVISVVFPVNEKVRKSNRTQKEWPSKEWSLLRTYQVRFLNDFTKYLEDFLRFKGFNAIAPYHSKWFKRVEEPSSGPSSNWSERHVAYAAGLGTFSINDGFITEKGIATKLISVVTNLKLTPDIRKAENHTANCLLCSKGICGACIKRCPVNAITKDGHDKIKCLNYVYGEESRKLAEAYGGNPAVGSGCGLCQTKVPCEFNNPNRINA